VAIVVLGAVLAWRFGGGADVRATVAAAGMWAPLVFLGVHTLVTVSPVPRTIFTVAAGVLFGSVAGLLLTVTATMLSAVAAFWLVRVAGAGLVERYAPPAAVRWVRSRVEERGLLAVTSLRLIPMLPFCVVNYSAALAGVRFWPYVLGTLVGVLPGTVVIVVLGDAVLGGDPPPAMLAVSVIGAIAGVTGTVLAARRPDPVIVPESARVSAE